MIRFQKKIVSFIIAIFTILTFNAFFADMVSALAYNSPSQMRVAVGDSHALLIDDAGNVWTFGNNDFSQLGDGTTQTRWEPLLVYHNSTHGTAVSVAAGSAQSLILTADGTVLEWGLGISEPSVKISANAKAISAGHDYSMAILLDGSAVIWSENQNIRTITDSTNAYLGDITAISVGSNNMIVLISGSKGIVYQLDTSDYKTALPVMINSGKELDNIVSVSAGASFAIAQRSDGSIYTWGNSSNGVLGQGDIPDGYYPQAIEVSNIDPIAAIAAGDSHVIAVSESGSAYGWGVASQKRLDSSKNGDIAIPALLDIDFTGIAQYDCGNTFNVALSSAGGFMFWGDSKELYNLILDQSLFRVSAPVLTSDFIGDDTITIKWNLNEYYTSLVVGFRIVYKMPDGTILNTQYLPSTISQITLKGLQPKTNYAISLQVVDASGNVDETLPVIAQTLEEDDSSIDSSSDISEGLTSSDISVSGFASSGVSSAVSSDLPSLSAFLDILLITIVSILLIGTILAVIYIIKKRRDSMKGHIKSIRVYDDNESRKDIGNDSTEEATPEEDSDKSSTYSDDDFIIRRPGDPK